MSGKSGKAPLGTAAGETAGIAKGATDTASPPRGAAAHKKPLARWEAGGFCRRGWCWRGLSGGGTGLARFAGFLSVCLSVSMTALYHAPPRHECPLPHLPKEGREKGRPNKPDCPPQGAMAMSLAKAEPGLVR